MRNFIPICIVLFFYLFSSQLFATIRYVKPVAVGTSDGSSWTNASADLQGMINLSAAGDTIWVAAGTYIPTQDPYGNAAPADNRDKTFFLKDSTKLFGSFAGTETLLLQRNISANPTILSGDFLGDDLIFTNNIENAYHVILAINDSAATILDGFTVKGGNANVGGSSITVDGIAIARNYGGGMYNGSSYNPISNCTFTTNNSSGYAGGIYSSGSSLLFSYCVFNNNKSGSSGAGLYSIGGPFTISHCIFSANVGTGGGGGVSLNGSLSIPSTIKNCVFTTNSCNNLYGGGAISSYGSALSIENSLFYANKSLQTKAAAIYTNGTSGSLSITNSVFTGNNITSPPPGSVIYSSIPTVIKNVIVWGNTNGGGTFIYGGGTASATSVSYSDVQGTGVMAGTNNINTDPLFVNAASPAGADGIWGTADDGLALQNTSPLLDAGTNTDTPTLDIVGNSMYNLTKDMGAYENQQGQNVYSGTAACQTITVANVTGTQWFYFRNTNGIVAAINPNGANLGTVTAQISDATGAITYNSKTYLGRSINFTSSNFATGINTTSAYSLRLYYYNTELTEYNTSTPGNHLLTNFSMDWLQGGTGCTLANYAGNASGNVVNTSLNSGVYGAAGNGFYLQFNLDHFTIFAATDNAGALPLTLLSFTGKQQGKTNLLQWQTANEINTNNFVVESSNDAVTFNGIGTIAAIARKNNAYIFTDTNPYLYGRVAGTAIYYRLKMIDNNGKFTYSNIIKLSTPQINTLVAYPNPIFQTTTLLLNDPNLIGTMAIVKDFNGRTVKTIALKTNLQTISLQNLAAGIYILQTINGQRLKLVKN